jgi:hypothetical protein
VTEAPYIGDSLLLAGKVRETRRMCDLELDTLKHRAALALEAKNREIRLFQAELEQILQAAAHMRNTNRALANEPKGSIMPTATGHRSHTNNPVATGHGRHIPVPTYSY